MEIAAEVIGMQITMGMEEARDIKETEISEIDVEGFMVMKCHLESREDRGIEVK